MLPNIFRNRNLCTGISSLFFTLSISDNLQSSFMGTNPYREKTPNRNMGRKIGRDDDEEPREVNVQEIGTDPQTPGPGPRGLGTNFMHVTKKKIDEEGQRKHHE